MEIEHIGDNKIRCALTEQEIESLGYDIDEIIANSEITQEFMHTVLELVEEQEHIQMEGISPMVKAELLQDHSMAITFGMTFCSSMPGTPTLTSSTCAPA